MKFFTKRKDGGPESTVTGYWLVEIKSLFSIVLLKFANGSRDNYHSHAFNSLNWVLSGRVQEEQPASDEHRTYLPSWRPIKTLRSMVHRVRSIGTTWVFSIRGPWSREWLEYDPIANEFIRLAHSRRVVARGRITPTHVEWSFT